MNRKSKAFSVVEFLVVSALVLLLFFSASVTLGSNAKVQYSNSVSDASSTITYELLDKARLAHCAENVVSSNLVGATKVVATACDNLGGTRYTAAMKNTENQTLNHNLVWTRTASDNAGSPSGGEQIYYVALDYQMVAKNTPAGESLACTTTSPRPDLARYIATVYTQEPNATFKQVSRAETTEPLTNSLLFADRALGYRTLTASTAFSGASSTGEKIVEGNLVKTEGCSWIFVEDASKVSSYTPQPSVAKARVR